MADHGGGLVQHAEARLSELETEVYVAMGREVVPLEPAHTVHRRASDQAAAGADEVASRPDLGGALAKGPGQAAQIPSRARHLVRRVGVDDPGACCANLNIHLPKFSPEVSTQLAAANQN